MSILSKLSRQENFTESEKNIVRYLLEHKDEMSNLTISKVTQDTFTSNASIMRLCKKLEVRGYRELRLQIIKESERQRQEGKPVDMDFPLGEGDSIDDITGAISDLMGETLQTMKGLSLAPALGRIAAWMREAPHVYYYAAGDTLLTVQGFANRLMKLGIRAMDADEHKEINARIRIMEKGDFFLCVSYSGKSIPSAAQLLQMKRRNVRTVLITAAKDVTGFQMVLTFPDREHYYDKKMATFYSQTAIFYLLNCIFAILYRTK